MKGLSWSFWMLGDDAGTDWDEPARSGGRPRNRDVSSREPSVFFLSKLTRVVRRVIEADMRSIAKRQKYRKYHE